MEVPRRPMGYWDTFNTFWRNFVDTHDRRPSVREMKSWYDNNAYAVWGANGPSWEETKKHSKGMRRLQDIPTYFRNYRRGRKKRMGGGADDDYVSDSESETRDAEPMPTPRKKKQPRSRATSAQQQQQQQPQHEQQELQDNTAEEELLKPKSRPRAVSAPQITISAAALANAAAGAPAVTLFGLAIPFLGTWRARSSSAPAITALQIAQMEQAGVHMRLAAQLGQVAEESSSMSQEAADGADAVAHGCGGREGAPLPVTLMAGAPPVLDHYAPPLVEETGGTAAAAATAPMQLHELQRDQDRQLQQTFQSQLGVFGCAHAQLQVQEYEEQLGPFSTVQQQRLLLLQQGELLPQLKDESAGDCLGAVGPMVERPTGACGGTGLNVIDVRPDRSVAAAVGDVNPGGRVSLTAVVPGAGRTGAGGVPGGIVGLDSAMLMQVPSSALPPDMRVHDEQRGVFGRLLPRNSTLKMVHSLFNRWAAQQDAPETDAAAAAVDRRGDRVAAASLAPDITERRSLLAARAAGTAMLPPPLAEPQPPFGPPVVTTGGAAFPPLAARPEAQQQSAPPQLWQQQEGSGGQWASSSPGVLPPQPPMPCALMSGGGSGGSGTSGGNIDAVGYITMPTPQPPCAQQGFLHPPSAGDVGYATPAATGLLGKRGREDDSPMSATTGGGLGFTLSSRKLQRGLSGVLGPLLSWMSLGRRNSAVAAAAAANGAASTPAPRSTSVAAPRAAVADEAGDGGVNPKAPDAAVGAGGGGVADAPLVGLGLALDLALDRPSIADGSVAGLLSGLGDSQLLEGLPSLAEATTEQMLAQLGADRPGAAGAVTAEGTAGTSGGGGGGRGVFRGGGDGAEREAAARAEAAGAVVVTAAIEGQGGGGDDPCAASAGLAADPIARFADRAGFACMAADGNLPTPFVVPEMQHRVSASSYGVTAIDLDGGGACAAQQLTAEMCTRRYPTALGARDAQREGRQPAAQLDALPSRAGSEGFGGSLLRRLSTSLSDYFKLLAR